MVNPRSSGSQEPGAPPIVPPSPLEVPTCLGTHQGSSDMLHNLLLGMLQQQQQQMTSLQQQITLLQQQQQQSKPSNYFLELKEAHAPTFAGSTDPLEAEKWITEMEKFCQALCIPKDEWVNVTTPFLISDADAWFISVRPAYESGGRKIDWAQFRDIFFSNYFPTTFRIEKENEFFNLKQGSLTVIQYASMFNQLGRFAFMVHEQSKVTRFKEGLNLNLREYMETPHATTYQGVLEQALRAERLITEKNQIRDSKRPRPCNEQYEETESAANKKATSANKKAVQEDLAGSSVHGQADKNSRSVPPANSKCYSQQPKPQSIKYRGVELLTDMLFNQTSNILGLKTLKVVFHHATKDKVVSHTIRLARESTVGDAMIHLKRKVELSHPNAELRLLKVLNHKIYEIVPLYRSIGIIDDKILRAEEVLEEEKNIDSILRCDDQLIHVYHFMKDSAQNQVQIRNFGEPFLLAINKGETLAKIKSRIQKRLQVSDEEYSKWKFAFISLGHLEYLQDSDTIFSRFPTLWSDMYGLRYSAWEHYLGLEHSDNTPKRSCASNPM